MKSEEFTLVHVVIGIQDLGDVSDFTRGVNTCFVVSGIERIEIKARYGGRFPKSDVGTVLGCVSGDRSIVGDGVTFHTSTPDGLVRVGDALDVPEESDRVCDVISSNLPGLSSASFESINYGDSRSLGQAMGQEPQAVLQSWRAFA